MWTSIACAVFVASVTFADPLQAASVGSVEGDILVNRGDGYRPVKGTLGNVPAGTQLMVRPGGSAIITYSGNCAVRIAAGVWSVNEQPPCADGRDFIDFTGWGAVSVIGTGSVNQPSPPGNPYRPPPPPENPPPPEDSGPANQSWLITGGLIAAGAAGAAVILSQGGGDDPASP